MVGLVNTKDFYVDSHYLCGVRSSENIFDLPKSIFECDDIFCYESEIKKYIKQWSTKLHMWPWMWNTSDLTDEVYIYEIENNRIIYYSSDFKEFFDARLIRKEQSLQGCEIFDYNFKFPKMF